MEVGEGFLAAVNIGEGLWVVPYLQESGALAVAFCRRHDEQLLELVSVDAKLYLGLRKDAGEVGAALEGAGQVVYLTPDQARDVARLLTFAVGAAAAVRSRLRPSVLADVRNKDGLAVYPPWLKISVTPQ